MKMRQHKRQQAIKSLRYAQMRVIKRRSAWIQSVWEGLRPMHDALLSVAKAILRVTQAMGGIGNGAERQHGFSRGA